MSESLIIRQARMSDATALTEVHVASWLWAYRGLVPEDYLHRMLQTLDARIELTADRLANQLPEQRTWVAEQRGQLVGFAVTGQTRDLDDASHVGEVWSIYLAPDAAGKGIGRSLFAHAVQDLTQRGYQEATLWVLASNERAQRFYAAAGWIRDGATKMEERPGAVLHEVRYRKVLNPEHPCT